MKKPADMPVMKDMCKTCPWREGSPYAHLIPYLAKSALTESSRICHSTGKVSVLNPPTGKPERFCRGARNVQLAFFAGSGFISEPTDEAWRAKIEEMRKDGFKI